MVDQVEKVNSLITELEDVTSRERFVLAKCADLLASLAMMQVNGNFKLFIAIGIELILIKIVTFWHSTF